MKVKASPPMSRADKKYRAENDLRSLREAEEIRNDRDRLRMANALLQQEMKALERLRKAQGKG